MKDVIEIIKTRRSVRNYKEDPVPDEDIKFLIDCARYAPSGSNMQPWSFLVIQNKEVMQKLSEQGKKAMIPLAEKIANNPENEAGFISFLKAKGTNLFYNAPLLVIIFGNKKSVTADWDCAMAAQNMMLAAHSRGIGSCWIGLALPALMDEKILQELGAPHGYKAVAPLIFGYPQGKTATTIPERIEPEVKWLR
ncbi:MAG: nitroreductase family protein [Candidatus Methanoperedens sp.]|nr:nitroreductase family protein [Candidatus Methanoperedens sp.]